MYNDLRKVSRPTRKKKGMKDFFILLLCYSYYNKSKNSSFKYNEFSLSETVMAKYFNCTSKTIYRWLLKLKDIGCIENSKREDAGESKYYTIIDKDGNKIKKSYIVSKYKKIRVGNKDELKFVNVYILDQIKLNDYLINTIELDVLSNIKSYKNIFVDYILFLSTLKTKAIEEIKKTAETKESKVKLSKKEKKQLKREKKIEKKIKENRYYLDKKIEQDKLFPECPSRYLEENSLRLTCPLCNTVNPENTDKINEMNYWRSSHVRNDILTKVLKSNAFEERDVNGSIYRLTYNLYHNKPLDINADIYSLIWNDAFDIVWPDKSYRKKFKLLLMPIYMKESSTAYRISQHEYIKDYYYTNKEKYKSLDKVDRDRFELYEDFINLTKLSLNEFLDRVRQSMHKILNVDKFMGADIFIQESNLHILMRDRFNKLNIKCINIYDGFYFIKDSVSKNTFYKIYEEALNELKYNLSCGIGSAIPA